jgi:radical SAM protein with 4Fe4S-binding SPASM domain
MWIKDSVIWKIRNYGSILYDVQTGAKIKLNSMGTRIFLLYFSRRKPVDHIIKVLTYEFGEQNAEEIKNDVLQVMDQIKNSPVITLDSAHRGIISLFEVDLPLDTCTLVITRRCNLSCRHCIVSGNRPGPEMSLEDITKLVDALAELKVLDLVITGGEPLLRKDLAEIIEHCSENNVHVTLFTNGTMMTDDFFKRAKGKKILLRFSLDGSSSQSNDPIRGAGTFDKVVNAIQKCVTLGIPTGIAAVLHQDNFREYNAMIGLAKQLAVSELEISEILPYGNAKDCPELALTPEQLEEMRMLHLLRSIDTPLIRASLGIDRFLESSFEEKDIKSREMCSAGTVNCAISPEGDVYPCQLFMEFPEMRAGNILSQPLDEVWTSSPVFKQLRQLKASDIEQCASCDVLKSCGGGCRARAYASTGSLYAPMDATFCKITNNIWRRISQAQSAIQPQPTPTE